MAKIAIVYASIHHKNTEKLLEGVARNLAVDLFDLTKDGSPALSDYDAVGYASGIYAGRMHKQIYRLLKEHPNLPKKAIALCTSGVGKGNFVKRFARFLEVNGFEVMGCFECKGFDTFGPLKWIGGVGKGRPDDQDILEAAKFVEEMICKLSEEETLTAME